MPDSDRFSPARQLLSEAVDRAFPGCVVEVGRAKTVLWQQAFGSYAGDASSPVDLDTVYDLASLTKVIATTSIAMRLVDARRLSLDTPVRSWLKDWRGDDRSGVTVRDLLAHAAGLTAYAPFYRDCRGRAEFEAAICELPLEYEPRSRSIYSDLGFILLAFIAADAAAVSFERQFETFCDEAGLDGLSFGAPADTRERTAPTGDDPWRGRRLVGEVHDANAWALGGVAGHAGLFGTARAVGAFARLVLRAIRTSHGLDVADRRCGLGVAPSTVAEFACRTTVPGSSRALGWDTMLPTSSCGRRMSPTAIGHTGFTGTSLWIDWEADLYAVLLSNRVQLSPPSDAILAVRPAFHDAVTTALHATA